MSVPSADDKCAAVRTFFHGLGGGAHGAGEESREAKVRSDIGTGDSDIGLPTKELGCQILDAVFDGCHRV